MKKSELKQIIREEILKLKEGYGTSYGNEKRREKADQDSYNRSRSSFKDRERNAGLNEPDGDRAYVKSLQGVYVKMKRDGTYLPALYHTPSLGPTDGKLYRKNKKTGGYFPVKK